MTAWADGGDDGVGILEQHGIRSGEGGGARGEGGWGERWRGVCRAVAEAGGGRQRGKGVA